MIDQLLPCPFCGANPELPDGDGTQYEIWCSNCGCAVASVQICDLMTLEERASDDFKNHRYHEDFIRRAKVAAIEIWNTRAQPADCEPKPVDTVERAELISALETAYMALLGFTPAGRNDVIDRAIGKALYTLTMVKPQYGVKP